MTALPARAAAGVRGLLLCGALLTWAIGAAAEEPPRVQIGYTDVPPTLDGVLSDGEWDRGGYIPRLTQATPDPGEEATQRTEVWLMTDGEALYVAARLWDTNPEEIVAQRMLRDDDTLFDDRFSFTIDTFLDRQNGYFFQTNANGVRRDALIEGSQVTASWDTRWFVATSVDEEGWTVEIALPMNSINFDANAEVWGLNIARGIRRRDEIDRWSDPVRERFLTAMGRAGFLEGMRNLRQGLGFQVVPALTTNRFEDHVDNSGDTDVEPSLDVFYKITPSLTASATVNTDFSEVEADTRQVNLTRFGLFFPERRDFFLQDALIFDFGDIERNGRPFFSRRIGLDRNGNEEDILGGGKLTGRIDRYKLGILNVVMDERSRIDRENLFVARMAANVLEESTVGFIVTHGDPEVKGDNTVVGADFLYRNTDFLDNKSFRANAWVQGSFSDPESFLDLAPDDQPISGNAMAYGASMEYPNDLIRWNIRYLEIQEQFNPALGFVNRPDIRQAEGAFRNRIRPESGPLRTIDTEVDGRIITDPTATMTIRSAETNVRPLVLANPVNDLFEIRHQYSYEFVSEPFSNLEIGPGEYNFHQGQIRFSSSRNRPVRGEILARYGQFFDGTRTLVFADLEVRPSKHFLFGADYEFQDIRLPGSDPTNTEGDGDRDVMIHIARARVNFFFTADMSWLNLVQYDSVSDLIGINSRFRWIIEDGRELFLVVNQGIDTARDDIRATETDAVVKLEWTFRF